MSDPATLEILEALEPLGRLHSKRMFGGHGIYCDDVFFALLADDLLYFKVDDATRGNYLARAASAFLPGVLNPSDEARQGAGYYEVPAEVQERRADFIAWARAALAVAKHKREQKRSRVAAKPRPRDPARIRVRSLLNLGPVSCDWLKSVGIETRADLEAIGSLAAYRRMLEAGVTPNLNLLYALEGALMELNVVRMPAVIKDSLRERLAQPARRKKP